jgi:peroxiredoxin
MDPVAVVGEPAPDFVLHDLDGAPHRLSEQRGQVLVLNFWSAGCPHCERLDQRIVLLRAGWTDRVHVWRIAPNDHEEDGSLRQAARLHAAGPVLRDGGQAIADRFGAQTTPHLFVIDAQGILAYAGAPDDVTLRQRVATRDHLDEAVGALLRNERPDPASTPPFGCAIVRRQGRSSG